MKIEALETVKHHPHYMQPGDQKTVSDDEGQHMVDMGWCKNVETGEVGEREGGPVDLDIHNSTVGLSDNNEGAA